MNERIDEEIGALLDGRVDARRRDELLARLATAGDDYDVFADTAAVLREAEEGVSEEVPEVDRQDDAARSTPVIPLRPRRAGGWRSPAVRTLAMAAAVASVALVPVLRSRMAGGGWRDPARLAGLVVQPGTPAPGDRAHPWGTRGGGVTGRNTGVAARVGALHMDLVIAARSPSTGDRGIVPQYASRVVFALQEQLGSAAVAGQYQEIADSTHWSRARLLERLAAARRDVVRFVDADYFAAGAWTEAAWIAAGNRNAAFFEAPESRKAVERIDGLEGVSGEAKAAATRLRGLVDDRREIRDWTSLQNDLDKLLRGLAR